MILTMIGSVYLCWRADEQKGQCGGYHLTLIDELEGRIGRNVFQIGDSNEQLIQHGIG